MKKPRVYWRWFKWKMTKDGWEPTDTGWLLSISMIWLVSVLAYPIRDGQTQSKLQEFLGQSPSEMGDTLAGLFSALAFIWIIVTVFMQSKELREQRAEIRYQRMATQDMARAMSAQAEVFEDERNQRREDRYQLEFEANLANTRKFIVETASFDGFVEWLFDLGEQISWGGMGQSTKRWSKYEKVESDNQFFDLLNKLLNERFWTETTRRDNKYEGQVLIEHIEMICGQLEVILDSEETLSNAQSTRLDTLRIRDTYELLGSVLSNPEQFQKTDKSAEI